MASEVCKVDPAGRPVAEEAALDSPTVLKVDGVEMEALPVAEEPKPDSLRETDADWVRADELSLVGRSEPVLIMVLNVEGVSTTELASMSVLGPGWPGINELGMNGETEMLDGISSAVDTADEGGRIEVRVLEAAGVSELLVLNRGSVNTLPRESDEIVELAGGEVSALGNSEVTALMELAELANGAVELAEREVARLVGAKPGESEADELDGGVRVLKIGGSKAEEKPGVSELVVAATTVLLLLPSLTEELIWLAGPVSLTGGRRLESSGACLGWYRAQLPRGPASAAAASDRACSTSVEVRISGMSRMSWWRSVGRITERCSRACPRRRSWGW